MPSGFVKCLREGEITPSQLRTIRLKNKVRVEGRPGEGKIHEVEMSPMGLEAYACHPSY